MQGGLWLDSNTILIDDTGINILFEKYKNFEFVLTITRDKKILVGGILSKPKSTLAFNIITKMTDNLTTHYDLEKKTSEYIPYNIFVFSIPVVMHNLLEITEVVKLYLLDNYNDNDIINFPKFIEYNCGLMEVYKYLKFYGCNMDHHHGKNFHKHWSNIQKTQRLFIT
jgi:hypothetical protein